MHGQNILDLGIRPFPHLRQQGQQLGFGSAQVSQPRIEITVLVRDILSAYIQVVYVRGQRLQQLQRLFQARGRHPKCYRSPQNIRLVISPFGKVHVGHVPAQIRHDLLDARQRCRRVRHDQGDVGIGDDLS